MVESAKKFEIKKWNAVALWAWDIHVDNCAICRNHIMDPCKIFCNIKQIAWGGRGSGLDLYTYLTK
jgi:RING-box protein 1